MFVKTVNDLPPSYMRILSALDADTQAFVKINKWVSGVKDSIANKTVFIDGGVGRGKTIAAVAAACELAWTPWKTNSYGVMLVIGSFCFITATELSKIACGAIKDDERSVDNICKANILILDDLGAEYFINPDLWLSVLQFIIDERQKWELVTIITSNMSDIELVKKYGERLASRVQSGEMVMVVGNDMRGVENLGKIDFLDRYRQNKQQETKLSPEEERRAAEARQRLSEMRKQKPIASEAEQ